MENNAIKIRNKVTGEEIVIRQKLPQDKTAASVQPQTASKPSNETLLSQRKAKVDKDIAYRGSLWENVKKEWKEVQSPNMARKAIGGLGLVSEPFKVMEAGIANPLIAAQRGESNPGRLLKESISGYTGKKLGEYGDVYRTAGVPGPLAATGGFILSVASPAKLFKSAQKALGPVSKMTDKGIEKAGVALVNATKSAREYTGKNVDNAFKHVDTVPVNGNDFYTEISKLPNPVINKLEDVFGNIEDLSQNLTVGQLRKVKQLVGKYKPNLWGKSERGISENIEAEDMNQVYGALKNLIKNTVEKASPNSGKKLMDLEEAASEVFDATKSILGDLVDADLKLPTKAGAIAAKMVKEGDITTRTAINTIKNSGSKARSQINKALSSLENFNRVQRALKVTGHILGAATYGGAIGAVGGSIASKVLKRNSNGSS